MPSNTIEAFFVGTLADLDPNEGNWVTDNASSLNGTVVGGPTDQLYKRIESLTLDDANADGGLDSNDLGQTEEDLIYQGVASGLDSLTEYFVTVTFNDGSTATTEMNVLQDVSGRVFLVPRNTGNPDNDVLDDRGIESIRLDSVSGASYSGVILDLEQDAFVVCVVHGTRLDVPGGTRRVEDLCIGDLVSTEDHGSQAVRWIVRSTVKAGPKTSPVLFSPGAVNAGMPLPCKPLAVSPQHRILIRSPIAARMFNAPEVFVPARRLVGLPGVTQPQAQGGVRYYNIMLDRHEVLRAHGVRLESFFCGDSLRSALAHADADDVAQLASRFPARFHGLLPMTPARPFINGPPCRNLIARHAKHDKPLFCARQRAKPGAQSRVRA